MEHAFAQTHSAESFPKGLASRRDSGDFVACARDDRVGRSEGFAICHPERSAQREVEGSHATIATAFSAGAARDPSTQLPTVAALRMTGLYAFAIFNSTLVDLKEQCSQIMQGTLRELQGTTASSSSREAPWRTR